MNGFERMDVSQLIPRARMSAVSRVDEERGDKRTPVKCNEGDGAHLCRDLMELTCYRCSDTWPETVWETNEGRPK